jgi:hypothetical protein
MKPTIENLVAAYAAGKIIRYSTSTGFSELICCKRDYPQGNPRYGFRHSSHQTEGKPLAFLTRSPEESIRAALTTPRTGGSLRKLEIWGKISETVSPPQPVPLVPLGENVTRDGRKVRVICNDRVCPGNVYPVTALVLLNANEEISKVFHADGKLLAESEGPLDLVGHLPPEPAKPREFWINHYSNGSTAHPTPDSADKGQGGERIECIHVREVLPGEADELADLRRWKAEVTSLLNGHPCGNDILDAIP